MNDKLDVAGEIDLALKARGVDDSFAVAVRHAKQSILTGISHQRELALKVLRLSVEAEASKDEEAARLLMLTAAAVCQPPLCKASVQALHTLVLRVTGLN
jgi:hypothetical protein